MEGKHVTLNLGSNDVLKRKLPDFNYDRNPIGMKWDNAFKILMFKFIESNIRELFICTIPNFVVPAADIEERFLKRIEIDCRLFLVKWEEKFGTQWMHKCKHLHKNSLEKDYKLEWLHLSGKDSIGTGTEHATYI